jgi:Kef-type K+ transport system membrane component KefB/nucleotide-binding universal stress UspA family protein
LFYVVLAAISVAVVIVVVEKGRNEKALPSIAGGYAMKAPNPCMGPVPVPVGGQPLPPTAPAQPPPSQLFNVLQSGQFANFTNNQGTLGGQLRLHPTSLPNGAYRLTGTIDCVSGARPQQLDAVVVAGVIPSISGKLGGAQFDAVFKTSPPPPGTAVFRIPSGIDGKYTDSPASLCIGSPFVLSGDGPAYSLSTGGVALGTVTYSTKSGAVFGDIACARGGHARLTAVANDLQLQSVQVIPLDMATPVPTPPGAKPGAKPALTTTSGLAPGGEKFTATKQRADFNKLVAAFFLSAAIVLVIARLFGLLAVRIGQPRVIGEVIAGIVLGPSVLGQISANLQATLFPTDVLPALGVAANLGLIFYMFLIGLELDQKQLKGRVARAAVISNASVAVPMLLGIAAALPLYKLVGPNKKFVSFALFMGVAMSITAFPVLARILTERRMLKRPLGALAIACAAIDDLTAWFLIAIAVAISASGSFGSVAATVGEAVAFTLVMWIVVRRILARMATAYDEVGRVPGGWFAAIIVGVILAAFLTETINIAFIFGGFVMGMVMPRHARLTEEITRRVEDFVITLLLPLFFVYTGLRMNITLLDRPALWLITLGLTAIAIVGKLAGAALAARITGFDWRASAAIGTLMNTRGLTELIVLNLALDVGAMSNALFAALVLMAVITTMMAGPLLKLLDPRNEYGAGVDEEFAAAVSAEPELVGVPTAERSILIAPQTDAALSQLVSLAEPLTRWPPPRELIITRLIEPSRGVGAGVRAGLQTENLLLTRSSQEINEIRARLVSEGVAARGVALTSTTPGADLVRIAERESVDLVITEGRRRLIGEGVPLGEVAQVLENAPCDVAVLVAREGTDIELNAEHPVVVPFGGAEHDWAALELGSWLAASSEAPLKLLGAAGQTDEGGIVSRMLGDAGLLVQQMTGVQTEPVIVPGGREGIVAAGGAAGLLVLGLSDRWRREGLGPTRSEIAKAAPAPVLFVRRGTRPGVFSSGDSHQEFKWSMAGAGPIRRPWSRA